MIFSPDPAIKELSEKYLPDYRTAEDAEGSIDSCLSLHWLAVGRSSNICLFAYRASVLRKLWNQTQTT